MNDDYINQIPNDLIIRASAFSCDYGVVSEEKTISTITSINDYLHFVLLYDAYSINHPYLSGSGAYYNNLIDDGDGTTVQSWDNMILELDKLSGGTETIDLGVSNIWLRTEMINGQWVRNSSGNVEGKITAGCTDSDGVHHTAETEIEITGLVDDLPSYGSICSNLSWSGTRTITGDLTVNSGVTLTLNSGTDLTFTNNSKLIVNGTLNINNAELDFVSPNSTTPNGVVINSGASATIQNTEITNARYGIKTNNVNVTIDDCYIHNNDHGIYLYDNNSASGTTYITDNNISSHTGGTGVIMQYSGGVFENNSISSNAFGMNIQQSSSPIFGQIAGQGYNKIYSNSNTGVIVKYGASPMFGIPHAGGNNEFYNNSSLDFSIYSGCFVYAESNWWGSNPPNQSKFNVPSRIDYEPYLTDSPGASAMAKITNDGNSEEISSESNSSTSKDWKKTLKYLQKLVYDGKFSIASSQIERIIDANSDDNISLILVELLWQAELGNKTKNSTLDLISKFSSKNDHKEYVGVAKMLKVMDKKDNRSQQLDQLLDEYKDFPNLTKRIILSKFLDIVNNLKDDESAIKLLSEYKSLFSQQELDEIISLHFDKNQKIEVGESEKGLGKVEIKENSINSYPNPFNPSTTISYKLVDDNFVSIKIFNMLGQEVATLVNEYKNTGEYMVKFNGANLPSGTYVCRIKAGNFIKSKRMLLVK
ncbi:MAG: T9SS type A sorting domain-containing protein [Melioribacteraceae bacterium]|nr:T9SS type A sorting domain-containing protein [Melioribacteraceae bacterium]